MTLSHLYRISNEGVISKKNITSRDCKHFSNQKSLKTRIKQIATVSLIFLSIITGEVFIGDKVAISRVSAGKNKGDMLPDVASSNPLPDVIPSNPSVPLVSLLAGIVSTLSLSMPNLLSRIDNNTFKYKQEFMRIII